MKAIQVSYSNTTGKYRAKAEGVPAIIRSKEENGGYTASKIAHELANKYNWLQFNGETKYRLVEGFLPNGNDVFVFVKDVQPLLDEVEYILSIDYDSQNRNLELCKDTVDTLREVYKKYAN
jgi:hypothetical protein